MRWYSYLNEGAPVKINRSYTDAFSPGWNITVQMSSNWEPSAVNGNPRIKHDPTEGVSYTWTVTNTTPETLIVIPESGRIGSGPDDETSVSVPLGILPAIVAVLLAFRLRIRFG